MLFIAIVMIVTFSVLLFFELNYNDSNGGGSQHRSFFENMGQPERQKTRDMFHQLEINLEEIYNGETIKLRVDKQLICDQCGGKGGHDVESCPYCNGKGYGIQNVIFFFQIVK